MNCFPCLFLLVAIAYSLDSTVGPIEVTKNETEVTAVNELDGGTDTKNGTEQPAEDVTKASNESGKAIKLDKKDIKKVEEVLVKVEKVVKGKHSMRKVHHHEPEKCRGQSYQKKHFLFCIVAMCKLPEYKNLPRCFFESIAVIQREFVNRIVLGTRFITKLAYNVQHKKMATLKDRFLRNQNKASKKDAFKTQILPGTETKPLESLKLENTNDSSLLEPSATEAVTDTSDVKQEETTGENILATNSSAEEKVGISGEPTLEETTEASSSAEDTTGISGAPMETTVLTVVSGTSGVEEKTENSVDPTSQAATSA